VNISFNIDKNGVANLVLDLPNEKVNKLSAPVMSELESVLNVIESNKEIRVLVISSAKKDIFIAGADINEIKDLRDVKDAEKKVSRGQEIMNKIAALKIPTIAVINGACLGGGLELALACQYRIAITNPKTQLGLPEVNLGIIPGFGGTQRLPILIGLPESLKIILSGKAVDARKALKIGLVDELMREEFFKTCPESLPAVSQIQGSAPLPVLNVCLDTPPLRFSQSLVSDSPQRDSGQVLPEKLSEFVTEILKNPKQNRFLKVREVARSKRFILERLLLGKLVIFHAAKKDLWKKTKGNYPAPFVALNVIKKTYGKLKFKTELAAFCELCVGDVSKNLIEIFFTNEALKKDSGVEGDVAGADVASAAVLGAGVMGGGIAWLFVNHDIDVRIKDISQKAVALGFNQIIKIFEQLKKIRKLTAEQVNAKINKATTSLDYTSFERIDFAVEAVVENMAVKKNILAEVETKLEKNAVIASNTSSLSISEMAHALQNPERFAGMHFFNPVNRMPLVEVIRGEKTSDETIATIVKLTKRLGKTPVVVKDVAGFLVNRILLPYMNEAAYLLQEGANLERVDSLIENFGMPMGPFVLADVVGIDVGVKVAHSLQEAYGERMRVADLLDEIYKNHKDLLGKKVGKGFYLHKARNEINPKLSAILEKMRAEKKIQPIFINDEEILDRCLLTMVNEAAKCLEEGVVKNARYLDMAMIMGCGFPAFRGGVLRSADKYGIKKLVSRLQELNQKHGKRFEVSKLLVAMAQEGKSFY